MARPPTRRPLAALALLSVLALAACEEGAVPPTPPIVPGASAAPREVNIVARDYEFSPPTVDFVPGETVLLHVVNGGLEVHEAVIGDQATQDAWEAAEAAVAEHPPGPTPIVSVPPDVAGLRVVVPSGGRVDVVWTVPGAIATVPWLVGCHIPGHFAKGMVVPVRVAGGSDAPSASSSASALSAVARGRR
jgi:uncharacterized cupredoxin-like copper-binding protein